MQKPNVYLFPQLDDNYGYLIKNPHETQGVLVDPSDLDMCLKILELNDCSASHIIITHHHNDHINAVDEIKSRFKSLVIGYKNDSKIPKPDKEVEDQEIFEIHGNEYKVIHTPGHTLQHINYFMLKHNILFSGDTLFSIGCGRMFEGNPEVFWNSLSKLKQLPEDTKVYCGHEYTMAIVYSCPQYTFVSSGNCFNLDKLFQKTSGFPSNILPHPMLNRVSPENKILCFSIK